MRRISDFDRRLFARVADSRLRGAHPLLPRLSRAADHGRLWFGTAGVLATVGGRTARRAALRGVGSLAAASLVSNVVVKWTVERKRPVLDSVPLVRRLRRQPWTSSFPSGHSASAAAFATGVALESSRYGLLVAPLAAAVAASRVYVGVHYPSDVLAGIALGAGAAALTCRYWPPRPEVPAQARPRISAPALPKGDGLVVMVNQRAGTGTPTGAFTVAEQLRVLLPAADIVECGPDDDFMGLLRQAAQRAAERAGALGICGGDGSVNAAATIAAERGLPLAVFPGGTLDHFALDLGVPAFEDTAHAVAEGDAVAVDLGRATPLAGGGETSHFVNTFSLGFYPELVRIRESLQGRLGKWPAATVALTRVLRTARPMAVEVNGRPRRLWMLFAGNGVYSPEGFAPTYRQQLDDGLLDVRAIDGEERLARTRLLFAALTGTLGRSHVYTTRRMRQLRLSGLHGVDSRAYDGEVAADPAEQLLIDKWPGALTVYRPAEPQNELLQRARTAAAKAPHRWRALLRK
ncbi:bifunctional phosphatase PAP2/diacylglycerol kinase family protein [Streptomyces rapamycinicus]|uniref:Phosphoesterase n=2 Tax=Streptomyces rapamycinicus TaxID=1226757 RepID=A0A0A0NEW6_STRRN|nr:phosphatase PAP2 family protein [Streptomyces rapamycinicus]AGP52955.1 phosphoesterase [Streptomyces rapamycinicus NRRL 5491]MBB4780434.1 undecaprenyl-diphosphatase [Streptomyces rapamycinicus]RLV74913.1 phosphoesterase [Streptomyces rapamycinicus NRRL 5491]UTO61160.1 phosphatase PAP2 family protein [Streptomyces rapamycinicus]UTP29105.1 phosphatase PAP2 family protein [Streptomyces rapamycinicus NRRL 5491]